MGTPEQPTEEPGDLVLLAAWREGDQRAGNQLFERHFEAIYRFFRSKLENGADDLVQETFLACTRNREVIRSESSFRTYLFCVARSKLFDALRKRMRGGTDVSLRTMADLRDSPSTWVARNEDLQLLGAALERLPLELQLVLELFYFEEQSASAVAQILEIPEGTVRSRIRRALDRLRVHIAKVAPNADAARNAFNELDGLVAARR
ncbi:MAG: sigma-70 family RNA polymerase sigma factor [Myxococcales bacterium]|nr:sigma-70 family RNA polymerase sigma factor [Myxococcales bacterium]